MNVSRELQRFAALLAALWALAACGAAFAQAPEQILFGPKRYDHPGVPIGGAVDHFTVPASEVGAPFKLRAWNGQANGQNRVENAWVFLNGVQVAGPHDFDRKVYTFEKTVELKPTNRLTVIIVGRPNTFIELSVVGRRLLPAPTSLAPNPLPLTAGAQGTLTATLAPAPTSAGTLSVASANGNVASVPASVGFAAGQTSVAIPVSALAVGTTTITAAANGRSASATVNVTAAPPTLTSLLPATLTVTQGASGTLSATISAAQSSPTSIALQSSNPAAASVPASVVVPAGQVSAPFAVTAIAAGNAQITASLNGTSATSQITVTPAPPTVVSLLPAVSTVALGANTTLTLTLSSAASADTVVPIAASPAGIVTLPDSVVVPAGATSASVPVGTLAYGQAGISASLNGANASALVNVVPPPVAIGALEPATFTMTAGATSSFTVRLNAAQTANVDVALESSDPAVLQVPASVTVEAGATSAVFTVTALATGDAVITASANGTSRTASVHVSPQPAAIVSLLPDPLPLQQGASGSLTATINVAQEAETVIALANSAPAVANAPASVTVPPGAISALIAVNALEPGSTQITASVNGTSASASVDVTLPPPAVTALAPATLSLPKGTPGVLRVTVSRAPNAPVTVALASSDAAVASVPAQVNIPEGALFADFPVSSNAVGQASITASLNGGSASATVTVAPAELAVLTLSPQAPVAYTGESVPFTATGTMTDGTAEDFTARVTWTSSEPALAVIAATGVASALSAGQTTIKAEFSFNAVQTGQAVSVSSSTALTVRQPVALALTAPVTTLPVGQSVIVTVTSIDAAPVGGLVVTLTGSGSGAGTFPATLTIPEAQTSAGFQFTATAEGPFTIAATAQNRLPGAIAFTILPQLAITGFTPASGPVGTAVAIAGAGFDANLSGNTVRFNGEPAVVASGSTTLLNVIVPPRATTGPITVTNFRGTVTSAAAFLVQEREAFDLLLTPSSIQVPLGGVGGTRIRLSSTGLNPYPYAATVSVSGLPAGVSATLDRPAVALNQDVVVSFSAASSAGSGNFSVTLTAIGASGVSTQTVSKILSLQLLAAGSTTVSGRVLHAGDDAPFEGARVRLGSQSVFTDATGTYRFVSPPALGDQVLLIDGNTQNSPEAEYPSGIAMPVNIVAGQDNKALTAFIAKIDPTKFTSIVPGAFARVTTPDAPNFALRIPQGAVLYGWDGQPVTKINVRTTTPDRLPIRPIPPGVDTRTVFLYYFFREGGANPTQPIPVTMPNDIDAAPGEQVTLWYYDESATPDANSNQWRVMGAGTVSQDGKSIVSNPGVGMPKFCCGASFAQRGPGPDTGPSFGDCECGNPVNIASGNATVFRPRPFGMSKVMPIDPNLQYRSTDPRIGLFGRGMSFSYDWFAQSLSAEAVRVIDPGGVSYTLSREADGVFRSRSGRSKSIGMEVTPTNFGRSLRLPSGMRYDFDPAGRLLGIQDLAGNRTSFTLNAQGFPTSLTDSTGKVYAFQLVGAAPTIRISRITDPAGRFVEFTYDSNLRLQTHRDQGGGVTTLEYDTNHRIIKKTDPRLAVTEYQYDSRGRVVLEKLPEGGQNSFAYIGGGDLQGNEARYTDANGNTTTYYFTSMRDIAWVRDALGRVTKFERDPATNQIKRVIDPAGRVTEYTYNTRGDRIRTVDAAGKQTLVEYDLRFRKPIRIENALGNVNTIAYDPEGNVASVTNAENETTRFTYTAAGQIETLTDALNRVTRFTYDAQGNLVGKINHAGETVTRSYDAANRLVALTDSLNRTTGFTYDSRDRMTEIRDAMQGVTGFAFDANDNLTQVTDQNNHPVERYTYDLRNRVKVKTDAKNKSVTYDYDLAGNRIRTTDRKAQVTEYTYDKLNRTTQVRDHDNRITDYVYDLAGNVSRISDTQSGDILMSYDALNRLTEVISAQGTVSYSYDAIGRRTSRTLSGGDVTTYAYDKANRLKSVTLRGRTAGYAYDAVGRLAEKVLPNGIRAAYSYDDGDRIVGIVYSKPDNSVLETASYAYDRGGQRTQRSIGTASLQEAPAAATYDETNRVTSINVEGEAFSLAYDDNGNLVSRSGPTTGVTIYTWNARNQLIAISGPSVSASFRYDAMGRRIEKTVNGVSTGFIYDGDQAVAELKGSAVDVAYHAGLQIDEVLARYSSAGDRTLLTDALGSVIAQAKADHSMETFYAYSPYGRTTTLGVDDGNPLQFTGRENDGTGLYYYRARYYDPVLKRFISDDPIGIAGGTNLYAYVGGNPVSRIDPSGLAPDCFNVGDCYAQAKANYYDCKDTVNPDLTCLIQIGRCLLIRNPILRRACMVSSTASCAAAQFVCINQLITQQNACDQRMSIDGYQFGENYYLGPDCVCYSEPRFAKDL